MNKRIKLKKLRDENKRKLIFYRGQMIDKNGCYTAPYDKYRTILFYNHCGNEIYFKSIKQAKRYVDSSYSEYQTKHISMLNKCKQFDNNVSINYNSDDIPF